MIERIPTLQAIRNRFDREEVLFSDPAITSGIAIASDAERYRITMYPQLEYGYEGFVIDAQAPQGIFGMLPPRRVETSRDSGGIMKLEPVSEMETVEDQQGASSDGVYGVRQQFHCAPSPAQEGLYLPGDPGFELFDQLQAELAELKLPVEDAVGTLDVALQPTTLQLVEPQKHGAQYQYAGMKDYSGGTYAESKIILNRTTDLKIGGSDGSTVNLNLDGSLEFPFEGQHASSVVVPHDPLMVYRGGTATIHHQGEIQTRTLEMEALMAFAGLYAAVRRLYI